MNYQELLARLYDVQDAKEITLKGRRNPILSCSIPDGPIPAGWKRVNEVEIQKIPGYQRIRWIG